MAEPLLLGIDVGTTGSKALLIRAGGQVAATATEEYPLLTPRPLWAEQHPVDWWQATAGAIRRVLATEGVTADQIVGVGLTGQMHGLVLLDRAGAVLRPAILWNDQRTGPQCAAITAQLGLAGLLEHIGNPVLPGFTAPKILWVREHEPHVYSQIAHVLLPKDYVRYCLTGELATDVSDASGTALLDVQHRRWSQPMLDALDIPATWLPTCHESPAISSRITEAGAAATGLRPGTPVMAGAGDQAAGAVGSGIVQEGVVSVTLGTSGVVFAATDRPLIEPQGLLHAFCHAVPGQWHLMGVMLSAAGSLRWVRDVLGASEQAEAARTGADVYNLLTQEAARAPAGSEGLLFLPYLTGERTPHPDPQARGVYCGLTLRHGKPHLVRAVLEGVAYGLRDSLELLRAMGVTISQVRVSGGGGRSPLWRQILADVFGSEIVGTNVDEGAAFGAALLAAVGAGLYPSVPAACAATIHPTDRITPGPAQAVYAAHYPIYRTLYPALAPQFAALGALAEA